MVSGGSTPTFWRSHEVPGVTEIRPALRRVELPRPLLQRLFNARKSQIGMARTLGGPA